MSSDMSVCLSICTHVSEMMCPNSINFLYMLPAWRSSNIAGRINEVTLRWARLVLGWMTVFSG